MKIHIILCTFVFLLKPFAVAPEPFCDYLQKVQPALRKILPSLVTTSGENKEQFTHCALTLVLGNPKDCEFSKFESKEFPHCAAAFKKESYQSVLKNNLEGWWSSFIEPAENWIISKYPDDNPDEICDDFLDYLLKRFDAFGGKKKDQKLWDEYCKKKGSHCKLREKTFFTQKFYQDTLYPLYKYLHSNNKNPAIGDIFKEIASVVLYMDISDAKTESVDLGKCLANLADALKKKLN